MSTQYSAGRPAPVVGRQVVPTPLGPVSIATDEKLVEIRPSVLKLPSQREEPLAVLLRMAGVKSVDTLGCRGPVVASAANSENADNPDVRRYEAKFGRDAFYTADFLQPFYPQLEIGTVQYFAAYQARQYDERAQAEPGKVPNHIRRPDDPLAIRLTLETGRRWPWFGGTDTTVQFVLAACRTLLNMPELRTQEIVYPDDHALAGQVVLHSGKAVTLERAANDAAGWLLRQLRQPLSHALLWAGMNRRDSFTVWTDSPNAFHHRNGRLPGPRVAPVSLQAAVHDALLALAKLREQSARSRWPASALRKQAGLVKAAVLRHYLITDERGSFLANGVDRGPGGIPQPMAVRAIDMGFALDSDLLSDAADAQLVNDLVEHLTGPDMLTPVGIAGKARDEVRFEKFDYHCQVWAFAVHKVARGLRRHGLHDLAADLDARMLRQTADGLLPENVGAGPELEYCPHILTVERTAANGRRTQTVKERTPAPFAAWTAGAVAAVQAQSAGTDTGGLRATPGSRRRWTGSAAQDEP